MSRVRAPYPALIVRFYFSRFHITAAETAANLPRPCSQHQDDSSIRVVFSLPCFEHFFWQRAADCGEPSARISGWAPLGCRYTEVMHKELAAGRPSHQSGRHRQHVRHEQVQGQGVDGQHYAMKRGFHPRSIAAFTVTSDMSFMNFPLLNDIDTISPRPILFIMGEKAHSRYFTEDAYRRAAEPKELVIVPKARHIDLYDRVDLIPFDKLTSFFGEQLNR
jgi:hypothetical protein